MMQRRGSLVRLGVPLGLEGRQNADSCVSREFKSLILREIQPYNYPDKAKKRQKRQKTVMEKKADAVVVNELKRGNQYQSVSLHCLSFPS